MVNTLSLINKKSSADAVGFINTCEDRFNSAVDAVVNDILSDSANDIVLLAGPSSSGKTTTAGIIARKISSKGRNAYIISLDDFYYDRADIPFNEEGLKDYENVTALDIGLIHKCFGELIEKRSSELPVFDFMTGCRSEETKHIVLEKGDVIIVEGLHALNPVITEGLDESHLYRVYISVSSRVTGDDGRIILNKRNLRLIRRMVRDFRHRNSSVENTLFMWQGVLKGEDKFLFPYESYADMKINSFHAYEPCMFRDEALCLLSQVGEENEHYLKAQELMAALGEFNEISTSFLPETSLLNEFIVSK